MDKGHRELVKMRMERALELLEEAESLLQNGSYKSANNRAYYAMEKGIKALLATKQVDTQTHSGMLKQFNSYFIRPGNTIFSPNDYQLVAKAERIRNTSDYDDFYIASKEESRNQVRDASYLVHKIQGCLGKLQDEGISENR